MKQLVLIGNPNCGKTTLFNLITHSYEHVGNWPGVTVEKKVGLMHNHTDKYYITDLPGVYSLCPLTLDESITTTYFLNEEFDGLIHVIDASQIERSFQLTIQLLEYQKPIIIALNMVDITDSLGIQLNVNLLQEIWGIPVIPIVARKGQGLTVLRTAICNMETQTLPKFKLHYGEPIENAIKDITKLLQVDNPLSSRWRAIQFLEGNKLVENAMTLEDKNQQIHDLKKVLTAELHQPDRIHSIQSTIRSIRESTIQQTMSLIQTENNTRKNRYFQKIDSLVTHPVWGIPIFLGLMFIIFKITFDWLGTPVSDLFAYGLENILTPWIADLLIHIQTSQFVIDLITSGLISGVGGVLVFVPQIFLLFLMISIIEDSGYMTRIAFNLDRIMQAFGLNGKTLIPMIISFGCNVPGAMATRTIEQPRERLITLLLTPLMSCSARLPVYSLLVGTFFVHYQSLVVFSLYVLGIIVALGLAILFSKFTKSNEKTMFFIEWPTYHLPSWKTLWCSTWEKTQNFVKKAGTFILGGTVLIWVLAYIGPTGVHVEMNESLLARIGSWIAPVFAPLGFSSWESGVALITGFLAKEIVVATMNIVYSAPDEQTLSQAISYAFTPLQAYSFMVFILLYIPCIATVAVIHRETRSWKWTLFSIGYSLVIAYALSFIVYQIGRLFLGN